MKAIAWEDAGTGDEGLASEPIEVDIPDTTTRTDGDFCYTIRINYVHPGYHMPECLGLRMNVYLSAANQTALAFYGSFEMEQYDPLDEIWKKFIEIQRKSEKIQENQRNSEKIQEFFINSKKFQEIQRTLKINSKEISRNFKKFREIRRNLQKF